ncbi:hypothetical protein [Dokdonia sp.]|uniref:hypothetical protein n=1 Tax=Dokdonia sp. TaxID=2024995 RepID=UPI0032678C31
MLKSISGLGNVLDNEDLKQINGSGKAIDKCCKPPVNGRSKSTARSACACFPDCAYSSCGCPCED